MTSAGYNINDFLIMENIDEYVNKRVNEIIGKKNDKKFKTTLVLSGGGVKGIAHIGALKALEEKNILNNIKTFAGTSIGGMIATLYVIGYTPDELYSFVELFNTKKMRSLDPNGFFNKFGLDEGIKFNIVLEKLFEAKNIPLNITFKQLYLLTNLKLIITSVCLNDKQVYYLSHTSFPDLPVILGVRMTTSFPFWFVPVKYNNKLFVDGGCIDNYPIQLFSKDLDSTIGIYLSENKDITKTIDNTEDFIFSLLKCLLEGVACNSVKGFEKSTVKITVPGVSIVDLDINNSTKKELFDKGYMSVIKFLKNNK